MNWLRRLLGTESSADESAADGRESSYETVTDCKNWKCPNCGELLTKGALGIAAMPGQPSDQIVGTSTCGACGAKYSQQEIYGGKYDFHGFRPDELDKTRTVPDKVSVVIFREGQAPPEEPEEYCKDIVKKKFGPKGLPVEAWRMAGWQAAVDPSEATAVYSRLIETGQMPDFGKPIDEFEGTGSDGNSVFALFFRAA